MQRITKIDRFMYAVKYLFMLKILLHLEFLTFSTIPSLNSNELPARINITITINEMMRTKKKIKTEPQINLSMKLIFFLIASNDLPFKISVKLLQYIISNKL